MTQTKLSDSGQHFLLLNRMRFHSTFEHLCDSMVHLDTHHMSFFTFSGFVEAAARVVHSKFVLEMMYCRVIGVCDATPVVSERVCSHRLFAHYNLNHTIVHNRKMGTVSYPELISIVASALSAT